MGILGGLAGGGQALSQLGMMNMQHQQKLDEMKQQEQLYQQRERFVENLKAPAEKVTKSTNEKGQVVATTSQWVPPADDNTPGFYKQISTEVVPPKYSKDTVTTGSGVKQGVLYNENDPTDVHYIGAPDDTEAQRTKVEQQNAGISGGRLAEEVRYHNQEHTDRVNGVGPRQSSVPHTMDLPGGLQVQGNLVPGQGFVPMQTPSGDYAAKAGKPGTDAQGNPVPAAPTDFDSINKYFEPASNFPGSFQLSPDQQNAAAGMKTTPMAQLSGSPIDAGGSGAQQTPRPAQASKGALGADGAGPTPQASAQNHGGAPRLQINKTTGAKRYVYPDGTITQAGA